jgi:hypothetical protein
VIPVRQARSALKVQKDLQDLRERPVRRDPLDRKAKWDPLGLQDPPAQLEPPDLLDHKA